MTTRAPIDSPAAWKTADVTDARAWTTHLTGDEQHAIVETACAAVAAGTTLANATVDDIAIPLLAPRIAEWNDALGRGRGFVLVRGFPVDRMTPGEVELAYFGLGLHLGTPVSQDARGTLLGHVRDMGIPRTSPAVRIYTTTERQDFHSDGADIVGLLCLQRSKSGGESRIASSQAIFNEMLRQRPDLVDVLYEPMCWDRNDEQGPGERPYFELPVCRDVDGIPRVFYIGWYIRDAQRHPGVPRLTSPQLEAMELIESLANSPELFVEMDFRPGDVQLLNNAVILHAREVYEDHSDPDKKRHLLRLWLRANAFAGVEEGLREGIPAREHA